MMKSVSRASQNLRRLSVAGCAAVLAFAVLLPTANAQMRDQVIIRSSQSPFFYQLELEPHLVLGTSPPGAGEGSGVGIGARGSWMLLPEGFLPRINDSVAIGFGFDWGHYGGWRSNGYRDQCTHFETAPNGSLVCTETTSYGGSYTYFYMPVVMQWNFWLTRRWSAFGEPGVNVYYLGNHGISLSPAAYVGGRFNINDKITLTGRLGYPTVSVGVSFMM